MSGDRAGPVVIQMGAMGDLVMLTAVCECLSNRWDAPVAVIASGEWARPIFRGQDWLDELLVLPGSRLRPWRLSPAKRRTARWLRARRGCPVYLFERLPKLLDVIRAAGVDPRCVIHFGAFPRSGGEHQVDNWLRMAREAPPAFSNPDLTGPRPLPRLRTGEADLAAAREWVRRSRFRGPLVLLQPGNKKTMRRGRPQRGSNLPKYWPEENWAQLARSISDARPDARVLVCGVRQERALAARIVAGADRKGVCNVAGELPLERLFALLTFAHSMISVDTGPAHAAAAFSCPLVVMYGGTDPTYYRPRGRGPLRLLTPSSPAYSTEAVQWSPGDRLTDISPERVFEAWRDLGGRADEPEYCTSRTWARP